MSTRPAACPDISPARRTLLIAQGWRAIGDHSMVSPERELVDGERTGRTRTRQFAIAYDEIDQRRGPFGVDGARGPGMWPKGERFR